MNGAPHNDNGAFKICLDRTTQTYRQRPATRKLAFKNTIDTGIVFYLHDAFEVGATPDDSVERLSIQRYFAAIGPEGDPTLWPRQEGSILFRQIRRLYRH